MTVDGTPMGPGFFIFFHEDLLGGDDAPTLIVYDELPVKTVKKAIKKVKTEISKKKEVNKEVINNVIEAMVDAWDAAEREEQMTRYNLTLDQATGVYRETLSQLLNTRLLEERMKLLIILMEM